MKKAIDLFFSIQAPKIVRHAFAAIAGWVLAHNAQADVSQLAPFIAALFLALFAVVWSAYMKTEASDSTMAIVKTFGTAISRQAAALIAGWMAANGATADSTSTAAVVLFLANYASSHLSTPDATEPAPQPPAGNATVITRAPLMMLLAALAGLGLSACQTPSGWSMGGNLGITPEINPDGSVRDFGFTAGLTFGFPGGQAVVKTTPVTVPAPSNITITPASASGK